MGNIFIQRFRSLTQDQVMDRNDLKNLHALKDQMVKDAPRDYESRQAQNIMHSIDKYEKTINLNYAIPSKDKAINFNFKLTPQYSESDLIEGASLSDKLAKVAQSDGLNDTHSDGSRCAAASLVSAFLLMGGTLSELADKLDLSIDRPQMSYEFIHRAQDALYNQNNTNERSGLTMSLSYRYRGNKITGTTPKNEVANAAKQLGLKVQGILGDKRDTRYQRGDNIDSFFQNNPKGSVIVGVYMDTSNGQVHPPTEAKKVNHAVVVFQEKGEFYLLNSGKSGNGLDNRRSKLSPTQMDQLVVNTQGTIFGVTR